MNITLRGVEPAAFSVREEIRVIDGPPVPAGALRGHRRAALPRASLAT